MPTGYVPEKDKKSKAAKFRDRYMKRLMKISKMPGTTGATKSEVYQRMSGISFEMGEYKKAEEYITKAIDALRDSFKIARQRELDRRVAEAESQGSQG